MQPSLDAVSPEAGERDIEGVDHGEVVVHGLKDNVQRQGSGLGDGPVPELFKVGWYRGVGGVVAELIKGKVKKGHGPFRFRWVLLG
ncbi:hypothetical protein D3C73_1302800 [compost metagenome]